MKTGRYKIKLYALGVVVLALSSGAPAGAAEAPPEPGAVWAAVDADLLAGRWEPARAAAAAAVDTARGGWGDRLGEALSRLALAEAGLGREREAVWHWQMAQNLAAGLLPAADLARFGPAGALLEKNRLRRQHDAPPGLAVERPEAPGQKVTAAKKVSGAAPALSPGSRAFAGPKWLKLQAIIGPDGVPTQPVVLGGGPPSLVYDVLEAVRTWQFEPGRKDGAPVAVFYLLEVDPPKEVPFLRLVDLQGDFADTEQLLRLGKWRTAQTAAERVWRHLLTVQPLSRSRIGVAFVLRALTSAGLGDPDAAICFWQAAQLLEPQLLHADLSAYGDHGALLEKHRYWQEGVPAARSQARPPSPVRHEFPRLATTTGKPATVPLAALLDTKGHVRQPILGDNPGGSDIAAAVALETVCYWRFRPATLAGQPVAIEADLPVQFLPSLRIPGQGPRPPAWGADTAGSIGNTDLPRPPG